MMDGSKQQQHMDELSFLHAWQEKKNTTNTRQPLPKALEQTELPPATTPFPGWKHYKPFHVAMPTFIDPAHEQIFVRQKMNAELWGDNNESARLLGEIRIVKNGWYDTADDCGYKANYERHHADNMTHAADHFARLVPVMVPDGWSFQHFLDGVLPKLVQALPYLQTLQPNITILTQIKDANVRDMWHRLGFRDEQLVEGYRHKKYSADELILICRTPPIHPDLWKGAKENLGLFAKEGEKVILVARTNSNSRNKGRLMLNAMEVHNYLSKRYNQSYVFFDHKAYSFNQTLALFQTARLIIGGHGGGLYNLNFAPNSAKVVEYMQIEDYPNGKEVGYGIFWAMSSLLGQDYWRVYTPSIKRDFTVNVSQLDDLLSIVDDK
eukprot:CAMPEP_0198302084 /NCGR_PEP_ID=MMETSP1449-20131203/53892_1 /TAXON_ID=420275 /ORGANISM="Attheya septentrionalis, Strain CCMP2084" /LENGTH=379 /DNA_ID=CAMNT_0044004345 /DNA_START=235 /DNA_END=1374 /DNA_ORIENTATION=+